MTDERAVTSPLELRKSIYVEHTLPCLLNAGLVGAVTCGISMVGFPFLIKYVSKRSLKYLLINIDPLMVLSPVYAILLSGMVIKYKTDKCRANEEMYFELNGKVN